MFFPLLTGLHAGSANADEKVKLYLQWFHQFQFAGYYAAQIKGFYEEEGLEVELTANPRGDSRPVEAVVAGAGVYGTENVSIVQRFAGGGPVRVLAAIFQHSPLIYLSRRDSAIRTPGDLVGKKVMTGSSDRYSELFAMLRNEGVKIDGIEINRHTFNIDDVIDKKYDVMSAYMTDGPWQMERRGVQPAVLNPADYGIDFYGDILFTSQREVDEHPERVAAFTRASLKGWRYAMSNVDEIIRHILTLDGIGERNITEEFLRNEAAEMQKLIQPEFVALGHMNPARWRHIADALIGLGALKSDVDVNDMVYRPARRDDYSGILNIVAVVAAGLLLVVGMIGIWTLLLRRQVKIRTAELKTEWDAREKAEAANRGKSELLATMNHELRTPLNAVVGFSQLLSMGLKGPINDDQAEIIRAIRSSGEHLLGLVTGFLDLSKIESGNYQFVEVNINTGQMLQEIITVFDDAVRKSGVRLSAELPPYLPNLRGDQLVFKQIFVNLLSNAIKFTPGDGEVHLVARVSDKAELVIEVRDTGVGIAQESIDTALSKFGQVDRDNSNHTNLGTGLGLTLVQNYIKMHQAAFRFESVVGEGTRAIVTFPQERIISSV